MGKLWIQCRMGLCSATSAGASGNIQLCVDPKTCADREAPHLQSSLQQITVRGPLLITPSSASLPTPGEAGERGETDSQKYSNQTSHTLVEVPLEGAVAIALASFLVGAMSTGVLWFLHSKAMQAKSVSAKYLDVCLNDCCLSEENESRRK